MRAWGCFAGVLAFALVPGAAAPEPLTLAPFAAHFTADWKSINVGTSDIELKADSAPGRYLYTWTLMARGVFRLAYDDVFQESWISVLAGRVRPEKYLAKQGNSTLNVDFDWDDGHVRGLADSKSLDLILAAGTQDVMSIQIQAMLDVANGGLPATFKILDKDQIKDFIYTLEEPARIRTALGELDTLVVASRRAGSNRVLKMWFAPSLGFVPVQAERFRDGRLEFAMRIKTLKR
jgi:hypothetical protein